MGLTREVRDFFTGRINRLLNNKLQDIYNKIDREKVRKQTVEYLFSSVNLSPALLTRFDEIEKQRDDLYAEQNEIKSLVVNTIQKRFPKSSLSTYRSDFINDIEGFAGKVFEEKAMGELYSELVPQIAQINRIKEDVESVVLLSTSETKLVNRLTEVLNKYGGDIAELKDYIPE